MHDQQHKLWTKNFFILWQGQLVSTLGDAVYAIALGFWVLAATGSTSMMGYLMAASTLPGVLISPFAGVWIDRYNRKKLLIWMDLLRGLAVALVAAAAFKGSLAVWMVFAAGIVLSIGGAIFRPGISSSIPDLVDKSKLSNANALFSIVSTGASLLGNVTGGILFQLLGAPVLFLINGLSYFFSGASLAFVKIPTNEKSEQPHFLTDMREGFRFMWKLKGLRYILLMAAVVNFFSYIAIVLILPLFQKTATLGPIKYGIIMACFMGGATIGFLFSSIVSIPARRKITLFFVSIVISNLSLVFALNQPIFAVMALLIILGGFFNSIVNVVLITTTQAATPSDMRGKVMAFMGMITQGLTPFAMALGGVLASYLPIKTVISASFLIVLAIFIPFYFVKSFKDFLSHDYEKDLPNAN